MINKDFYPTPIEVIERMISSENLNGKHILEPSAGSGNIVDYLNSSGSIVSYCEIEPKLQKIIGSKAKFIGDDFLKLTRTDVSHFDFIIMNPPFSNDDKHILHAWEIAPGGCVIISLCNWETLSNRYTRKRVDISLLIRDHGASENWGECFDDAERKTNVEVGFIRLEKPKSNDEEDWSDYFSMDEDMFHQENGMMQHDQITECVGRYVGACKLYNEVTENAVKMSALAGVFGVSSISFTLSVDERNSSVESFKIELRKKAWAWIFRKMNIEKYMTSKLKEDLNKFIQKQQQIPFTVGNIHRMLDVIVQTHGQRIDKAMIEVFDSFTEHHHENRHMVEGWKTNSHYMINEKIIVPYIGEQSGWNGYPRVAHGGRYYDQLMDFQKCLCVQNGINFNTIPNLHHDFFNEKYEYIEGIKQITQEPKKWGVWYDWGFFEIKIFKKGTLHMKFKERDVWARFNMAVAKIKGFELPTKF